VRDAWNNANAVQYDENGTPFRRKHDHFDAWHSGGGVSPDIGSQYDSHGIAKSNPLGALLNILENGIDRSRRFDTAPLVPQSGSGAGLGTAGGAYKDGPFILLSKPGQTIMDGGVATVLVSDPVAGTIPALQARFPNVQFIPYSGAQKALTDQSNSTQTTTPPSAANKTAKEATAAPTPTNNPQTNPADISGESWYTETVGIDSAAASETPKQYTEKQLSSVKVTEKVRVNGKVTEVTGRDAQEVLAEIDETIESYEKILNCLGG
jgi:hypothetical protein